MFVLVLLFLYLFLCLFRSLCLCHLSFSASLALSFFSLFFSSLSSRDLSLFPPLSVTRTLVFCFSGHFSQAMAKPALGVYRVVRRSHGRGLR